MAGADASHILFARRNRLSRVMVVTRDRPMIQNGSRVLHSPDPTAAVAVVDDIIDIRDVSGIGDDQPTFACDDHVQLPHESGLVVPRDVHPPSPVELLNHVAPPLDAHGP